MAVETVSARSRRAATPRSPEQIGRSVLRLACAVMVIGVAVLSWFFGQAMVEVLVVITLVVVCVALVPLTIDTMRRLRR